MGKPILCLDFDGVIHSYSSGWKGPREISDPPVPGALEFIVTAMDKFEVHIFSSRSRYWFGRRAMRKWLQDHLFAAAGTDYSSTPKWLVNWVAKTAFADPWDDEVQYGIEQLVSTIKWPTAKPPALITIDDRAITFEGEWPSCETLMAFKPWNKRKAVQAE